MSRVLSIGALSVALALLLGGSALTTKAEDAPAKGSVSGKVVNADGGPVAGATVGILNPSDIPAKADKPAKQADNPAGKGGHANIMDKAIAKATTADDGTYKLTDVPAGKYIVLAFSKGAGRGKVEVEVTAGQDTKAADIKLVAPTGGKRAPKDGAK